MNASERAEATIRPEHVADLAAALGVAPAPRTGEALPPLWHWAFFNRFAPASAMGPDGRAERGGMLPFLPERRRMWAGGRLAFHNAIPVGASATRLSEIVRTEDKDGRSGRLRFVTVRHRVSVAGAPALDEEHDLVFRDPPRAGAAPPAPPPAPLAARRTRRVVPDPLLLFRYSALTLNGHRIHYDLDYATRAEGYRGIVVHGPLVATWLAALGAECAPERRLASFEYRGVSPLFAGEPVMLGAREDADAVELWAANPEGRLAMRARAGFG